MYVQGHAFEQYFSSMIAINCRKSYWLGGCLNQEAACGPVGGLCNNRNEEQIQKVWQKDKGSERGNQGRNITGNIWKQAELDKDMTMFWLNIAEISEIRKCLSAECVFNVVFHMNYSGAKKGPA